VPNLTTANHGVNSLNSSETAYTAKNSYSVALVNLTPDFNHFTPESGQMVLTVPEKSGG